MSDTRLLLPDDDGLDAAAAILSNGGLVALPTETVYGLAADATDGRAVAAIYAAKGRPSFNPLIAHVPDIDAAKALVDLSGPARLLADAFWPGPLTLVLPMREGTGISPLVTAGLSTLAVRVPAHPVAQAVLRRVDRPLAAPSANPSGRISPTTAGHVMAGLSGRIAAVLDAGSCGVGLESTIVGLGGDGTLRLLRPGAVTSISVKEATGLDLLPAETGGGISAPGQLASHYAPNGTLRLDAKEARAGEVLLGFGPVEADLNLSPNGDLAEAAANLFGMLHRLDGMKAQRIAVSPIPRHGLGLAINDRLARAAAPRD